MSNGVPEDFKLDVKASFAMVDPAMKLEVRIFRDHFCSFANEPTLSCSIYLFVSVAGTLISTCRNRAHLHFADRGEEGNLLRIALFVSRSNGIELQTPNGEVQEISFAELDRLKGFILESARGFELFVSLPKDSDRSREIFPLPFVDKTEV